MFNKYIDKIFKNDKVFYAHTKESSSNELLYDHLKLTYEYYKKQEKYKNLEKVVKEILKSIYIKANIKTIEYAYDMFKAAIFYHDIGKINPAFQKQKMKNNTINKLDVLNSEHAIYSSNIYIDAYIKDLQDNKNNFNLEELKFLMYLIYTFSYVIAKHHVGLKNITEYTIKVGKSTLRELYNYNLQENTIENMFDDEQLDCILNSVKIDSEGIYILNKLLYSVLITADYYATYEFSSDNLVEFDFKKNDSMFDKYKSSELYKNILNYKNKEIQIKGINKLRSDMFIETEIKMLSNLNKNIFYLEAPTGAGKTNMSINLAKILYEKFENISTINYIFPFNTLIEQTSSTFEKYFKKYKDYVVVNSLNPMVDENDENLNYDMAYIKSTFSHYPIKITSHINLFDTLFGISKTSNYTLYNYVNSVVIIDEIQAYSNKLWRHIIKMLDKYAKLLNIKFIIMSATLPKLDDMLNESSSSYCNLIDDTKKYYNNQLFKNRVELDFKLLESEMNLEKLKEEICKHKGRKILVEFIKKQTARDFFNMLKEEFDNVYEITGDDNNYTRKLVINKINNSNDIIVVATQTIEAGVDIDMDIGFKDISVLDSEEQFLGRINRSCKKQECIAYFFNLDDAKLIYKNDYRLEFNLLDLRMRNILETKNFVDYYNKIMNKITVKTEKYNKDNILNLNDNCLKLRYKEVEENLKLIDTNTIQLFLNYEIETDKGIISGEKVWKAYKNVCMDNKLSYAKKNIKLSKLKEKFNLFIYNIYGSLNNKTEYYNDKLGSIYYINNGNDFIINGKFDRKFFQQEVGGIFL